MNGVRLCGALVLLAAASTAGCDEATTDGDRDALVRRLAAATADGQARLSYAELWGALEYTDEAPDDPTRVLLFYSGRAHPKSDKVSSRLNPDHGPDSWNREHVWPKSHGFDDERALAHNDLHHIRASDVTCNADRGALDFDDGGVAIDGCAARRDGDSFEPRDAVKGDVARMLFYMDVRYNGDGGVADLRLVEADTQGGSPFLGHLCTLLRWNVQDPVDDLESRRHERIVEVQGNRNPFVEDAALAAQVFGPLCP